MATVYTVTVEDTGRAHEEALARAAEFFGTNHVTAELIEFDVDTKKATYRLDKRSGTLLG